jgi:hypothetical protein
LSFDPGCGYWTVIRGSAVLLNDPVVRATGGSWGFGAGPAITGLDPGGGGGPLCTAGVPIPGVAWRGTGWTGKGPVAPGGTATGAGWIPEGLVIGRWIGGVFRSPVA